MKDIPAFPRPHSGTSQFAQEGMGLRDYFAAKAMQAMLAHPDSRADVDASVYAKGAYVMANAMMKAREL
jgi:hypothetical protein